MNRLCLWDKHTLGGRLSSLRGWERTQRKWPLTRCFLQGATPTGWAAPSLLHAAKDRLVATPQVPPSHRSLGAGNPGSRLHPLRLLPRTRLGASNNMCVSHSPGAGQPGCRRWYCVLSLSSRWGVSRGLPGPLTPLRGSTLTTSSPPGGPTS